MISRRSRALSRETRASSRPSKFCRRSRALSREIRAYSPARLWLSSARRSLVCAPLTEGERTYANASCWRRDDRGLDLVEVECAMSSSRSTSSRHCFMATSDGVRDVRAAVCCRAACTAAVPGTGQLGTYGVEEAASSSTRKSTKVSAWCSTICTIMLSEKTSQNLKPSPLPGAPNVEGEILRPGGGMHSP
jgi:hypothetical protein